MTPSMRVSCSQSSRSWPHNRIVSQKKWRRPKRRKRPVGATRLTLFNSEQMMYVTPLQTRCLINCDWRRLWRVRYTRRSGSYMGRFRRATSTWRALLRSRRRIAGIRACVRAQSTRLTSMPRISVKLRTLQTYRRRKATCPPCITLLAPSNRRRRSTLSSRSSSRGSNRRWRWWLRRECKLLCQLATKTSFRVCSSGRATKMPPQFRVRQMSSFRRWNITSSSRCERWTWMRVLIPRSSTSKSAKKLMIFYCQSLKKYIAKHCACRITCWVKDSVKAWHKHVNLSTTEDWIGPYSTIVDWLVTNLLLSLMAWPKLRTSSQSSTNEMN